MNKVVLMGRLTRDPDVRYTQGDQPTCISRYSLAVDRKVKDANGNRQADFINCVAFGKAGEFAEKFLRKGIKICISGRIQTGSYTNKDGTKVYTTDVVVEEQEFCESKATNDNARSTAQTASTAANSQQDALNGFMNIPDEIDEELPFM